MKTRYLLFALIWAAVLPVSGGAVDRKVDRDPAMVRGERFDGIVSELQGVHRRAEFRLKDDWWVKQDPESIRDWMLKSLIAGAYGEESVATGLYAALGMKEHHWGELLQFLREEQSALSKALIANNYKDEETIFGQFSAKKRRANEEERGELKREKEQLRQFDVILSRILYDIREDRRFLDDGDVGRAALGKLVNRKWAVSSFLAGHSIDSRCEGRFYPDGIRRLESLPEEQ